MKQWIFIGCVILVASVLIFHPAWGWRIHQFLGTSFLGVSENNFAIENTALKAELAKARDYEAFVQPPGDFIPAFVYSSYPFGFRNEILLGAGRDKGVMIGETVVIAGPSISNEKENIIFLGKVEQVFETTALAMTVFDSRLTLAVRTGDAGTDALLVGGNEPKLTLIPKTASVRAGDAIYSAGAPVPYGIAVGEVTAIGLSSDNLFEEGVIAVPYDINGVHEALILKNHGGQ